MAATTSSHIWSLLLLRLFAEHPASRQRQQHEQQQQQQQRQTTNNYFVSHMILVVVAPLRRTPCNQTKALESWISVAIIQKSQLRSIISSRLSLSRPNLRIPGFRENKDISCSQLQFLSIVRTESFVAGIIKNMFFCFLFCNTSWQRVLRCKLFNHSAGLLSQLKLMTISI